MSIGFATTTRQCVLLSDLTDQEDDMRHEVHIEDEGDDQADEDQEVDTRLLLLLLRVDQCRVESYSRVSLEITKYMMDSGAHQK